MIYIILIEKIALSKWSQDLKESNNIHIYAFWRLIDYETMASVVAKRFNSKHIGVKHIQSVDESISTPCETVIIKESSSHLYWILLARSFTVSPSTSSAKIFISLFSFNVTCLVLVLLLQARKYNNVIICKIKGFARYNLTWRQNSWNEIIEA